MSKYIPKMPYGGGPLTAEGAKEILRDGTIRGKKLTDKQKKYFGFVAGGGTPRAEYGYPDITGRTSSFNYDNSNLFANPQWQNNPNLNIPQDQQLQNVPQFTPTGQPMPQSQQNRQSGFKYNMPLKEINLVAAGVTTLANTLKSRRDFRDEQRKYYEELQQPVEPNNFTQNDLPIYMKNGGWIQGAIKHPGRCHNPGNAECPKGSPQYNLAMRFKHGDLHKAKYGTEVEAEKGEAYQDDEGAIDRISESAPSHEQGGVVLQNVDRVLENTSTRRKDRMSKALQISPEEMQTMFNIDTNKTYSHSEALDKIMGTYNKDKDKYSKKINKSLDTLKDAPDDVYATNSLKHNLMGLNNIPDSQDIFDVLFNHQENVKAAHEMKYGGKAKYGYDPNDPYNKANTKQGSTSDTGLNTTFDPEFQGSLEALNRRWKDFGIDGSKLSNKDFQAQTYDYLLKNDPQRLRQVWKQYGNTNQGKKLGIGKNFDFNNLSDSQLADLKGAYVDGLIGGRTLRPPVDVSIERTPRNLGYTLPVPNGTPNNYATIQPPAQQAPEQPFGVPPAQEPSKFHEPLHWYDLAGPLMTLASSGRIPAKYNPAQINEVRLKLQNPEPALRAGQAQYNQATSMLPNNAAGVSNLSDIFAAKYAQDNQVLGTYENANNQIKNQEILYNANARDRQSVANQQSRQVFEQQYLTSLEAERQQKLSAFDDLFTRVALNRKLNREGDLIQQMFPNFNQYGRYNGNQRYFYSGVNTANAGGNTGFQVMTDPNTGQRYRVAYGPDGKLISSSKIFTDNKAIGAKTR